jgi:hypothetical protein
MRTRKHYLPIAHAAAGMVLAEPVQDAYQRTYLPALVTLTEEHLQQLSARHAEYICVAVPDERTDEQIAADTAMATRRVAELFQRADVQDPTMAALLHQVLAYRSN